MHQWHKAKPADASSNINAKRMWYMQKPSVHKALTGPDAKPRHGRAFGERIGLAIGKMVGVPATPEAKDRSAATNAQEYTCRHCDFKTTMGNVKRDMAAHLARAENKTCLDLYSQSLDAREKSFVKLVHEPLKPPIGVECRKCGYKTPQNNAKRNMVAHLKRPENIQCLELYSDSTIPRDVAWVRAVRDTV